MVTHYSKPNRKIVVDPTGAADQIQDYTMQLDLWRRENAVDTARLLLSDPGSTLFNNTIVHGDDIAIYVNYKEVEDPLTNASLRFYGYVEDMIPSLDASMGSTLVIPLRHYGRCFLDLLVGEEYGSASANPLIDTPLEVLTDGAVGIVPKSVEEFNGNASGYTIDQNFIADVVSGTAIKYLYYPYKPAINSLHDIQNHSQAIQAETAGIHWIVKTEEVAGVFTTYLLLGTVGAHEAGAIDVESKWATWWNTNQANSTIAVKIDINKNNFVKQRPEANYILYHGQFVRPGSGDAAENNKAVWGGDNLGGAWPDDDAVEYVVGSYSIDAQGASGNDRRLYWPITEDMSLDLTKCGGLYNIAELEFNIYTDKGGLNGDFTKLRLHMQNGVVTGSNSYYHDILSLLTDQTWHKIVFPVGDWARSTGAYTGFDGWTASGGTEDWADVDAVTFEWDHSSAPAAPFIVKVDGLRFKGQVIRGAYDSNASQFKIKKVYDAVAKDDSLNITDLTFPMARFAYAELLRACSTPITGQIVVPGLPTILAGQFAHIHATEHAGGYRINSDMRITEHHLQLAGQALLSYLTLTDDAKNSIPLQTYTQYNVLQKMTRPEDQTRHRSSVTSRDVDITQSILEKSYAVTANWWQGPIP
jgi:hypothetical protein